GTQLCTLPAPACENGQLVTTTLADPPCDSSNQCAFTVSRMPCDTPPPPSCSGGMETDYQASGTCSGSRCDYSSSQKSCASGCAPSGDVCAGDPCAGSPCSMMTPAPTCNGHTFVTYGPDSCDSTSGSCVQHPSMTDCTGANPCLLYGCDPVKGC